MKNQIVLLGLLALCTHSQMSAASPQKSIYHKGWIDFNKNGVMDIYEDPKAPLEDRVQDLLSQMTLDEKTCQMATLYGSGRILKDALPQENWKTEIWKDGIGNIDEEHNGLGKFRSEYAFPYTRHVDTKHAIQRWFIEETRLGIPVDFTNEGIRGLCHDRATYFPAQCGQGATWNKELIARIAEVEAREADALGYTNIYSPILDISQDPRWGRCVETYGEDPYLVTLLGVQSVKGYQGDLNGNEDVLACIKHFVGGSEPINGTNGSPTDLSERTLREVFFPPFEAGVKAGVMSLMTAHNELNGIPCHSNEWLMQDILRGEWNFPGFVVSDWMDIEHIHDLHATAENLKEAFYQSIMGGMDMHMHGIHWNEMVVELVREGRIPESRIDESVRRILDIKFRLGLFEQPYADEAETMKVRLCDEHRATALESARNGIVLLKNDGVLPLDASRYKKIMVTGINADDQNILGDWSAPEKDENVITILEGLKMITPNTQFDFVDQGWDPRNMDPKKVAEAAARAKNADLNIVVAGEYMMRFRWNDRTDGEDTDRSDIDLVGLQNELIEKVAASGKPTILILVNGRPLGVQWAAENLPAIVEAWAPGMYGGQAVAEILYGQVNPSAKLAITIPHSVGQLQMIYNHKPSQYFHPYAAGKPSTPLYPFGHGLSYTTYKYDDLKLAQKEITKDGTVDVSVKVTNTGDRDGVEIVQLYIRDKFSSVTRPVKELKDFARVPLKAGESQVVNFKITPDKLAFYDKKMKKIVEPGEFIVMVGASSDDKDLLKDSFFVK